MLLVPVSVLRSLNSANFVKTFLIFKRFCSASPVLFYIYSPMISAQTDVQDLSSGQYLIQVLVGLGAIVALIFLLAWGLKWVNRMGGMRAQQHINVVSQTPLGIKEKLVIVEVANTTLLLGLTPQNISMLHKFEEGELAEVGKAAKSNTAHHNGSSSFNQIFQKFSGRE